MALPAGDQLWYSKVLGLHCDGANNSTTFTDVKGKTVTAVGNAKVSTSQSIFGGASGYCDGAGDGLEVATSSDFNFGSQDFTVRGRFRCSDLSTYRGLVSVWGNGATANRSWAVWINSNYIQASISTDGTAQINAFVETPTIAVDTWYDIEFSRYGTSLYLFLDGVSLGTPYSIGTTALYGPSSALQVGMVDSGSPYIGWFEEIEIYKGAALHASNFTPAGGPFPDTYVRVSGTTRDANGNLASRLVRVYRRDTGALAGQVVSDATTGEYAVEAANSGTTTPIKYVAYMHTTENGVHVPWRVLGLHCDGTNTSTTFTDVKGKTVTAVGNAQISTAQYPSLTGKTSSGYVDGTGDYLSLAASSDFNFGTGDFTIRCMFYLAGNSAVDGGGNRNARLFCLSNATTTFDIDVEIQGDASTTGIGIAFYSSANGLFSRTVTITKDVWHDIEVSRSGTSLRLFLDGTQLGATFTNSASWGSSTSGAYVGGAPFTSNYYFYLNGYISEVEVYKGVALHTEDFTPLTVPFYDEIGTATENAIIYDNITPY